MATNQQVIQDIKRAIGLIRTDIHDLSQAEKNQMVQDTIEHFNHYVSPGWLKYRKSVSSDSDSGAVLEWQDEGAYCYGLNGEKFIDCLGGFGIYTCGHRNPEILDVVKAQLDHQAQRALERQQEQRRHERNLQRGKKKPWAPPPAAPRPQRPPGGKAARPDDPASRDASRSSSRPHSSRRSSKPSRRPGPKRKP